MHDFTDGVTLSHNDAVPGDRDLAAASARTTCKREYFTPQLIRYGSLNTVTQAAGNVGKNDAGAGVNKTAFI